MDPRSKIYVAGHRGLVGSAILRRLEGKGFKNRRFKTSRELDLRRQEQTEAFFESERPDYVFLAAAKVGGILANATYKAEFIYDNMAIALNIIHAAYRSGVKKVLNLGSSCIYPKFAPQPMKEEHLLTGPLEPTNEAYAVAKIAAIKLCRFYNEQYGTNFISVMPTNLYGPCDNFNLETGHVLPALIRKFHLAKLLRKGEVEFIRKVDMTRHSLGFGIDREGRVGGEEGVPPALKSLGISAEEVVLWGSGEGYREFLYADDLAEACILLMDRYDAGDLGEFVNIGQGEEIKIKDLALLIKRIVGFEGKITYDSSKPEGTPRKLLDLSKMNALGWKPRVPLEEGIEKTYAWYVDHLGGGKP
jgi:GDP-L-fucose synthase